MLTQEGQEVIEWFALGQPYSQVNNDPLLQPFTAISRLLYVCRKDRQPLILIHESRSHKSQNPVPA